MKRNVRNIASSDITEEKVDSNRVMEFFQDSPVITTALLAERTGFSTRKIGRIVKELRENGLIVRAGSSREGYWEIVQK